MKTPREDLVHEHEAIEVALNILSNMIEKDGELDYTDINNMVEFLKEFSDKCHHGKEEGFLFPALEKAGVRNEGGPIGVMLSEHTQGRNLIREMQDSITGNKVIKQKFIVAAKQYIGLLRNHIQKENTVLFPMIDARISASEQNELYEKFEIHEEKVIGAGRHEELHVLLKTLVSKYLLPN